MEARIKEIVECYWHPNISKTQLEVIIEFAFKAGQEECAKTHFKPDWELKAQDVKCATEEAYKAGQKAERERILAKIEKMLGIPKTDKPFQLGVTIFSEQWQAVKGEANGESPQKKKGG